MGSGDVSQGRARDMAHDEVVDKIIEQLRFQDQQGGDFHQEPYKGDFFRLYR
jgi:hypothetical protein